MNKKIKWMLKLMIPVIYLLIAHRSIGQTSPLSIKQAIDMALTSNRSLKADSFDISIQEAKNKELAGYYRPQVNYTSGMEYNPAIPSQMLPGDLVGQPTKDYVAVPFGSQYSMKSGVEVTQTIYKKDLNIQLRSRGLQMDIAKSKYNLSKEELVYQVASTFYSLQNNAELIRTTNSDYQNLKEVLTIAKAQFENGLLKRIDYESLEINVANKQSSLNQLKTQYNDQLAYFNYLLGLPVTAQTFIEDRISADIHPVDGSQFVLQREDIRLSNQMIQLKEEDIKKIRAEKSPSISSYFRYNYQSQFNDASKAFNRDYWFDASTVGVSVSIPLFDGHRRKNRISAAQFQLEQLRLDNKHTEERAQMELFSATGTLSNDQEQYQINKRNLALAERVFSTRKALYTEGVTTLVELLDAERELSESRTLYMQAMIDVQTGWLNVHKAKGTLLTDFLKSI
ncbi:MAG TPA: TolC family protein [Chitinophagaceae bacterium]